MNNEIWRLNSDWLCAYTEDPAIMAKVKRSYPMFQIHAEYFKEGKLIAIIYRVPSAKKKTIKRLLNVRLNEEKVAL